MLKYNNDCQFECILEQISTDLANLWFYIKIRLQEQKKGSRIIKSHIYIKIE